MHTVDRINSCRPFAERRCSHQPLMERLYLIYQIFQTEELLKAEALCHTCGQWSSYMSGPSAPSYRLSRTNA
jgi:hypothetical protein